MKDKMTYAQRISLHNKSPEEQKRILKLFNDNINIAYKLATKYYKTDFWDYNESLQIAQLGLFKACLIWDPNKYKLTTLAYNIINRDFIDFDKQQKRQVDVIMSLDEEIDTGEDITIKDLIADSKYEEYVSIEERERMSELNEGILYVLDEISDELNISKGIVKIVYLMYIESTYSSNFTRNDFRFIKKSTYNMIIERLQIRLREIIDK